METCISVNQLLSIELPVGGFLFCEFTFAGEDGIPWEEACYQDVPAFQQCITTLRKQGGDVTYQVYTPKQSAEFPHRKWGKEKLVFVVPDSQVVNTKALEKAVIGIQLPRFYEPYLDVKLGNGAEISSRWDATLREMLKSEGGTAILRGHHRNGSFCDTRIVYVVLPDEQESSNV